MLNKNLQILYKPSESITIDEQLYPYRGHTKFTQYMPSKPAKYGIKVWWICNKETKYPLQGIMYKGKTGGQREKSQGERVVKELVSNYKNRGRNVTMNNFFTTLPLVKLLLSWNLTVVGTLRKNKTYIPRVMAASKKREEHSTIFGFQEKICICSYVPKKNRSTILLSSMHLDAHIPENNNPKKKPDIILYYNKHKIGVDTMDQMLGQYTTQRRSNRWPLVFFYNILDVAALASYIIYYEANPMLKKKTCERRLFLRQLGEDLARPAIEERANNVTKIYNIKTAIESIIGKINPVIPMVEENSAGRKKIIGDCHICNSQPIKKRRKTKKSCSNCLLAVCNEHSVNQVICTLCNKFLLIIT